MFSDLITELGHVIGMELSPDASGALTLVIDGQEFVLQYFDEGEEVYIVHRLGVLPEESAPRLAVSGFLLHSNCFFRGVGGGVLGTEGNDVYYTLRIPCASLSGRELEHVLRACIDTCSRLRKELAEAMADSAGSGNAPDDTDAALPWMLKV